MKEAARGALRSRLREVPVRGRCRVADPLPVVAPSGAIAGWFVGIALGDRLLGFLQYDEHERLLRTSWFPLRRTVDELPSASTWLDVGAVRGTAERALRRGESLGAPVLSFDHHPTRLLWRVPVERNRRPAGHVEVIGESATRVESKTA